MGDDTTNTELLKELISRFENFISDLEHMVRMRRYKRMEIWLDNDEVCRILNISKRTLQNLRDKGMIGFSQVNHKIFYKPEDIARLFESSTLNR